MLRTESEAPAPATVPGRFGSWGGRYAPETPMGPPLELEEAPKAAVTVNN